jgi:DNA-binding MarR family transcriptional regulator
MKTKEDSIRTLSFRLMRIMIKHSALEEQPIRFGESVVLTPREVHSIQAIGEHEQINIKELGDYFGITKSAASQMATKLLKKGLIKKRNPAHNNKELQLSLTKAGWKAFYAHESFHEKHMAVLKKRLKAEFTDLEIARAAELLVAIENAFDERISDLISQE